MLFLVKDNKLHSMIRQYKKVLTLLFIGIFINCGSYQTDNGSNLDQNYLNKNSSFLPTHIPESITDDNYDESVALLNQLSVDSNDRIILRDKLLNYTLSRTTISEKNTNNLWNIMEQGLSLYNSKEIQSGKIDVRFKELAQNIINHYQIQGDGVKNLVALKVLASLDNNPEWLKQYNEFSTWLVDSRKGMDMEAQKNWELAQIYYRSASIYPTDELVDKAINYSINMYESFASLSRFPQLDLIRNSSSLKLSELQTMYKVFGRAVYDIIGLLIRVDKLDKLNSVVERIGRYNMNEFETKVVDMTNKLSDSSQRKDSLWFLSRVFAELQPEISIKLCHEGEREYPSDDNFPLCLGILYSMEKLPNISFGYLDRAITLNNKRKEAYNEMFKVVADQIDLLTQQEDINQVRKMYSRAEDILQRYSKNFPNEQSPLSRANLYYFMGMAEYDTGNINNSIERFEKSLKINPQFRSSLLQIGMIYTYRNDVQKGLTYLRKALDVPPVSLDEDQFWRGIILEFMGDLYRYQKNSHRANSLYEEAENNWERIIPRLNKNKLSDALLKLAVLNHRLNKIPQRDDMITKSIAADPDNSFTYTHLISFLTSEMDVSKSNELYNIVFNHAQIKREWKIYSSMWVAALNKIYNQNSDKAIEYLSRQQNGDDWVTNLAKFYSGTINYEQLVKLAKTKGQTAEAYFYEALPIIKTQPQKAKNLLQKVLDSEMMAYFEYQMARELINNIN